MLRESVTAYKVTTGHTLTGIRDLVGADATWWKSLLYGGSRIKMPSPEVLNSLKRELGLARPLDCESLLPLVGATRLPATGGLPGEFPRPSLEELLLMPPVSNSSRRAILDLEGPPVDVIQALLAEATRNNESGSFVDAVLGRPGLTHQLTEMLLTSPYQRHAQNLGILAGYLVGLMDGRQPESVPAPSHPKSKKGSA